MQHSSKEEVNEEAFKSFSQDFNDLLEKKTRPMTKRDRHLRTSMHGSQGFLETMQVNFQTCADMPLDLAGGGSSQKFASFTREEEGDDDEDFKDALGDALGDEETLHQV
jgi:hypothetical protein